MQNNNLPEEIKKLISSPEVYETLQRISKKNNLHLDQEGELEGLVDLTMAGFVRPENFTSELMKRAEIEDENVAKEITAEVSRDIFEKIRGSLAQVYAQKEKDQLPLTPKPDLPPPAIKNAPSDNDVQPGDRERILEEIENPHPVPMNLPPVSPIAEGKTDIVAQKLDVPVKSTQTVAHIEVKAPETPAKAPEPAPTPKKQYETDPYREPIA